MALQLVDQYVQQQANEKATDELVSNLQMMGYEKTYVLRAIQVHKKSKFGSNWNLSLLVEIIMRLKQKEQTITIFTPHFMTVSEPLRLRINDTVDYRFENGRFILCRIVEKNINYPHHIIKLHPLGRPISDSKYDKYCNINDEYTKLAIAKSISLRRIKSQKHIFAKLKIDDYIDINPLYRVGHEGWKSGRIIKLDPNSSQIKVLYHNEKDKKNYSYWVHLQNVDEVAEFRSKSHKLDSHQLKAEFDHLEEEYLRLQRQSVVDMSQVRYSVLNKAPVPAIHNMSMSYNGFMNNKAPHEIATQSRPRVIPKIIKDEFNNNMSSAALGNDMLLDDIVNDMAGNNYDVGMTPMGDMIDMNTVKIDKNLSSKIKVKSSPKSIPKIKENYQMKHNDFNNNISSVALGNDMLMDDIIDEMDGTSGNTAGCDDMEFEVTETPTGMSPMVDNNFYKTKAIKLQSSNSEEIEYGLVKANDCHEIIEEKCENEYGMMDKLQAFGYDKSHIMNAMINDVTDKTNLNDIMQHINTQNMNNYDDKLHTFVACMCMDDINNLKEFDTIDHRNIFGKFCPATIICKNEQTNSLQIYYNGWTHQYLMDGIWDGWCDISIETQYRFAQYKSISHRESHEWKFKFLRVGSLIELRPITQKYHKLNTDNGYYGWQCGEIFAMDSVSGQIQCKYMYDNEIYLYWLHLDNEEEVIYIDNCYDIGDDICVYNTTQNKWMSAKICDIEMNCISIYYIEDNSNEKLHVCFDAKRLIFPQLAQDIKYIEHAIIVENLKWKLIKVTPTNNTIFQCFAYMIYGDLNLASNIKNECIRYIRYNKHSNVALNNVIDDDDVDEVNILALCMIYKVRIRIFKYNVNLKRLDIVFDRGVDDLNVPIILLSKHLNKYYNIIIDKESLDQIPFYYH